ncbi:hypothetical protein PC116_g23132 [Phytophthora cactorum]|nr:hypothetical protein PC116_g23132 [Phytophthora cactorum]
MPAVRSGTGATVDAVDVSLTVAVTTTATRREKRSLTPRLTT